MIDCRHVALGVAVAASVATSREGSPALFEGLERLDGEPFELDPKVPTRDWVMTTEVVLPPEAEADDFTSSTAVSVYLTEQSAKAGTFVSSFRECGSETSGEPVVAVDDHFAAFVDDAFADCAPEKGCTRTFCLEVTSNNEQAVEVAWYTWTSVQSEATVDYDVDSIPVPIDITIEEIEP